MGEQYSLQSSSLCVHSLVYLLLFETRRKAVTVTCRFGVWFLGLFVHVLGSVCAVTSREALAPFSYVPPATY